MKVSFSNRLPLEYEINRRLSKTGNSPIFLLEQKDSGNFSVVRNNHGSVIKVVTDLEKKSDTLQNHQRIKMMTHNQLDSKEILKDVLNLGSFFEENLDVYFEKESNKPAMALYTLTLDEYLNFGDHFINEVFEKDPHQFREIVGMFLNKYGIEDQPEYVEPYSIITSNITNLLVTIHHIYQLFSVINYFQGKKQEDSLKIFDIKNHDIERLKLEVVDGVNALKTQYMIKIVYDKETRSFTHENNVSDIITACSHELINTLISSNYNYKDSFLSVCKNCYKPIEIENRNTNYCDDYECKLSRDRKRQKESKLNKKKEKERMEKSGSISKKEKHVAN